MSWIFAVLLTAYGLLRGVWWLRGQLAYLGLRHTVPESPNPRPTPAHISGPKAELFGFADALRVRLGECERRISVVMITDPDVPIGQVRHHSFRWSVLDAWCALQRWHRETDPAGRAAAVSNLLLEDAHRSREGTKLAMELIRPVWWQAVRARALDPFALDDARGVRDTLTRLVKDTAALQDRLAQVERHPYRGSSPSETPQDLAR